MDFTLQILLGYVEYKSKELLFSQKLADSERNPPHPLRKKRSTVYFDDASYPVQTNPCFPDKFISHFSSHSHLAVQGWDRESGGGGEQLCRRGGRRVLSKHWRGSSFYIVCVPLYAVVVYNVQISAWEVLQRVPTSFLGVSWFKLKTMVSITN